MVRLTPFPARFGAAGMARDLERWNEKQNEPPEWSHMTEAETNYSDPRRWKALALLSVAYLMVVLDVSIVNVALPSIQEDLGFSPENLQWVVSGYALTFGGFLLLGGRLGDLL